MEQEIDQYIYLDNNSTTKIDPSVLESMMPFLNDRYANASSSHRFGTEIKDSVTESRNQIAELIKANPEEIIFTSGSTEAINLALKGMRNTSKPLGKHIITLETEHSAMLDCFKHLKNIGYETTLLPVNSKGMIDLDTLKRSIREDTILVSVMTVNNEIGVIQPLKEISKITHEAGAVFFTDATQAVGKMPINVNDLGIDMLCMSGHKIYGPKGVGALYVKTKGFTKFSLEPIIHGGGHERGLRSGTLNVPGIIGLGKACDICSKSIASEAKMIKSLRDRLENALLSIDKSFINGDINNRLHNISNICFSGVDSEAVIIGLKNIMVSNGSACTSTSIYPSHVLKALGLSDSDAFSSIRLSIGRFNTFDQIETAIKEITRIIRELRNF